VNSLTLVTATTIIWATMSQPPPAPPQYSPDGKWWWNGHSWVEVPPGLGVPASSSGLDYLAALRGIKAQRSFGLTGGCNVKFDNGYIELKGALMSARARVPIEAVEYAVVQQFGIGTMPRLVLVGRGGPVGHADLPVGRKRAGEQAAEWINDLLRQHR
jgi:hypothetical protein